MKSAHCSQPQLTQVMFVIIIAMFVKLMNNSEGWHCCCQMLLWCLSTLHPCVVPLLISTWHCSQRVLVNRRWCSNVLKADGWFQVWLLICLGLILYVQHCAAMSRCRAGNLVNEMLTNASESIWNTIYYQRWAYCLYWLVIYYIHLTSPLLFAILYLHKCRQSWRYNYKWCSWLSFIISHINVSSLLLLIDQLLYSP